MYKRFGKRALDIILSLGGLIAASPFMLIIALCVAIDTRSNPIFTQKRFGQNRKMIPLYKFKSMRNDAPHDMPTDQLADPKKYITRTGHFLRRTSLDELPQLFNILMGHMSVVGPRPALWNQYHLMDLRDEAGATPLRPGLTGWAQINGRDMLNDEEKAAYDGEYARKLSFKMDCRCFFGTFLKVLAQDGMKEERK